MGKSGFQRRAKGAVSPDREKLAEGTLVQEKTVWAETNAENERGYQFLQSQIENPPDTGVNLVPAKSRIGTNALKRFETGSESQRCLWSREKKGSTDSGPKGKGVTWGGRQPKGCRPVTGRYFVG